MLRVPCVQTPHACNEYSTPPLQTLVRVGLALCCFCVQHDTMVKMIKPSELYILVTVCNLNMSVTTAVILEALELEVSSDIFTRTVSGDYFGTMGRH